MQRIKELRTEKKLTQAELGKKINSTQRQVSKWELGAIEPNIADLQKLADFFGCSIDYLVGREDEDGAIMIYGNQLSKDENQLIDKLRALPDIKKKIAYKYIDFLSEEE